MPYRPKFGPKPHCLGHPLKDTPNSQEILEPEHHGPISIAGTWELTLQKHELDGASRDRKCAKFDDDFAVVLYLTELEGEIGSGDAGNSSMMDSISKAKKSSNKKATPLYREKEAYKQDCEKRALKGVARITFEQWLVMEKEDENAKLMLKRVWVTTSEDVSR